MSSCLHLYLGIIPLLPLLPLLLVNLGIYTIRACQTFFAVIRFCTLVCTLKYDQNKSLHCIIKWKLFWNVLHQHHILIILSQYYWLSVQVDGLVSRWSVKGINFFYSCFVQQVEEIAKKPSRILLWEPRWCYTEFKVRFYLWRLIGVDLQNTAKWPSLPEGALCNLLDVWHKRYLLTSHEENHQRGCRWCLGSWDASRCVTLFILLISAHETPCLNLI